MELDWTTFLLEIINFIVLLWILNRFLYTPVMKVIAQRRAAIQKTLADAQAIKTEAEGSQLKYENRLSEWEQEREKAREQLHVELSHERNRQLEHLRAEIDQERKKAAAVDERRMNEFKQQAEATAVAQAGTFASRLLSRLGGPELEQRIIDLVMQDLARLPDHQLQAIRAAAPLTKLSMKVTSAYPLAETQRETLCKACRALAGREVACEFNEDPALIAGLRMSFGSWVLRANLQDELSFFTESVRHA